MLTVFIVSLLFGFALSDDCSATTQTCTDASNNCMKRGGSIKYPDANNFGSYLTASTDKYGCEENTFCDLILADGTCSKIETEVRIPYKYTYDAATNTGDDCIASASLTIPITLNVALDCCNTASSASSYPSCTSQFESVTADQDDATVCPVDTDLSETVNDLFSCYLPDDILAFVQCNPTVIASECPDILSTHISTTYPECACSILYDELGHDGYDDIPTVSGWIQEYVASMGDYFSQCGDLTLDCDGLVPDCDYNNNYDYDNCTDTPPDSIETGGRLQADIVISVCALKKFRRSVIFKFIKDGFDEYCLEVLGSTVTLELYMTNYKIRKNRGNVNGNSQNKKCKLEFDIVVTVVVDYDNYETLKDIYKAMLAVLNTDFDVEYAAKVLALSMAEDLLEPEALRGFIDAEVSDAQLTLYREDGGEYTETGSTSKASYYSFGAVFAFLFATIVFS